MSGDGLSAEFSARIEWWSARELTRLNRAILARSERPERLVAEVNALLAGLPEPGSLTRAQARRLVVHLGLWGSSVARHGQERNRSLTGAPERSFDALRVGEPAVGFRGYFAAVARASGDGHPARDTYASLVRWNVPTVEARWDGARLAVLEGVFGDRRVRTYTGDRGERQFLLLLKQAEVLERAANELLWPVVGEQIATGDVDALDRMRVATGLLYAVHEVNKQFIRPSDEGLTPEHFIDVLRQFAVHWTAGDVPPSGAQDPEFLKRDFMLGIAFPDYPAHVRRVFPALLARERVELEAVIDCVALPELVLRDAGLRPDTLPDLCAGELARVVRRAPALGYCYRLLRANVQLSNSHLMLTKRFLFNPVRAREQSGAPDNAVVPNNAGTTGMLEQLLERLARARRQHQLKVFADAPIDTLLGPLQKPTERDLPHLVRFTDHEPQLRHSQLVGPAHSSPDRERSTVTCVSRERRW